jgi:hypothetical protein
MRPDDDGDTLTLSDHLDQTSAATVSRMLREVLEIKFDDLDDFEDASRIAETTPYHRSNSDLVR